MHLQTDQGPEGWCNEVTQDMARLKQVAAALDLRVIAGGYFPFRLHAYSQLIAIPRR